MGTNKDIKKLIKRLEAQGFTVSRTKKNHFKVYAPDGRFATVLPGTPSDWRSIRNAIRDCKQHGYKEN